MFIYKDVRQARRRCVAGGKGGTKGGRVRKTGERENGGERGGGKKGSERKRESGEEGRVGKRKGGVLW